MTEEACPHCGNTTRPSRAPSLRVCCDTCYDALPRDLPGVPLFRSAVRWMYSGSGNEMYSPVWHAKRSRRPAVLAAITEYLTANPPAKVS